MAELRKQRRIQILLDRKNQKKNARKLKISPNSKLVNMDIHPIMSVVLQLVGYKTNPQSRDDFQSLGTAVLICDGLALTASHVIHEYCEMYGVDIADGSSWNAKFSLQVGQIIGNNIKDPNKTGYVYDVSKVIISKNSDIALLVFPCPENGLRDILSPLLTLESPKPGEKVSLFGYHSGKITSFVDGNLGIERQPAAVHFAEVYEVVKESRGKATGPHFAINAPTKGAMSGGIVLNEAGSMCGIIGSGFDFMDDGPNYSTCLLLFPILMTGLYLKLSGDTVEKYYSLYDLANRYLIKVDKLNLFSPGNFEIDDNGDSIMKSCSLL